MRDFLARGSGEATRKPLGEFSSAGRLRSDHSISNWISPQGVCRPVYGMDQNPVVTLGLAGMVDYDFAAAASVKAIIPGFVDLVPGVRIRVAVEIKSRLVPPVAAANQRWRVAQSLGCTQVLRQRFHRAGRKTGIEKRTPAKQVERSQA